MRIPLSDNQMGYIYSYKDGSGYFINEENYRPYMKGYRKTTWAEFKEMYPFRCGTIRSRSKIKTRYCR